MIETLTRLGVDLAGPTLVAFAVVALVAGLLGMAAGSFLELLRTWRLAARTAAYEADQANEANDDGPGLGPEVTSDPGLEEWYTDTRPRSSGVGMQVAGLVLTAALCMAVTLGLGALLASNASQQTDGLTVEVRP